MAAIDAYVQLPAIGGVVNERLTLGLRALHFDAWPPHDDIVPPSPHGALTRAFPVSASARAISGYRQRTLSDDWYHRVHIVPRVLALGNLISTQVSELFVWNAWFTPISLTGIDGVVDGITLDGPDDFPYVFEPLQYTRWDVSVLPDGPSSIDTSLTWTFDEVPGAKLEITGVRIVAWTLPPDWTDGIRERLAFATDVMMSDERDEQRRALLLAPRRSFETRLVLEGRERSLFEMMVRGWGGRIWAIPVWPDIQRLQVPVLSGAMAIACDTEGRDFRAGGLALLRGESPFLSEVVQIDEISADELTLLRPTQMDWPVSSRLYPVRTARFADQPRTRRLSDSVASVNVTFILVEPSDWPEAELPEYRGFPVLDAPPDESSELGGTYERMLHVLDNVSGIPFVLDTADAAFAVREHAWVLKGITERSEFRSLVYALRGRQVAAWVPTFADDIRLKATLGSSAVSASIENIGYTRFGLEQLGCKDIRIELHSGDVFYRRITNAAVVDEDLEQITIDEALGETVEPEDVRRICFMTLMRSQSDEIEIRHHTDVEGVATSGMTFVGVADE